MQEIDWAGVHLVCSRSGCRLAAIPSDRLCAGLRFSGGVWVGV